MILLRCRKRDQDAEAVVTEFLKMDLADFKTAAAIQKFVHDNMRKRNRGETTTKIVSNGIP